MVCVGAFHMLLLMLQVNCGEQTKVEATEILKLMNEYKNKLGGFDSRHYKYFIKFNPIIFAFCFFFLFFFRFQYPLRGCFCI
ncbi:hypothetical protein Hanom_Chr00s000004g01610271 [Helianthus anomalus]